MANPGEGPGDPPFPPPLYFGKRVRIAGGRKIDRASDKKPSPPPPPNSAQGLDPPLNSDNFSPIVDCRELLRLESYRRNSTPASFLVSSCQTFFAKLNIEQLK